jgi:hypothetical protein
MTEQLHPIWFRLPKRFYRKLELLAESAGSKPEDALEFALDVLGRFVVAAQRNQADTREFVARLWPVLRVQQKSADTHHVNLMDALEDAVKLYRIYGPITAPIQGHGDVAEAQRSPGALAILRWAKIPPDERSKQARELALKRWNAKKRTRRKAAGEKTEG